MKLAIVNCAHASIRQPNTWTVCQAGQYGGKPGVKTCELCSDRAALNDGPALEWSDGEPAQINMPLHAPRPLSQGEVTICQHKIPSDWNDEGQRILKAGTIGYDGAKAIIEVEAWNESLAHQK